MFDHSASPLGSTPEEIGVIAERTLNLIESGHRPERVFVCVQNRQDLLAWDHPDGTGRSVLLFSTPQQAKDYADATKVEADLGALIPETLPRLAAQWTESGAESFVLNRCPRCGVGISHRMDTLASEDAFVKLWALDVVRRSHKGERMALAALESFDAGDVPAALDQLREIRDHVETAVPHLHALIAVLAHHLNDDAEKTASLEWLSYFPEYEAERGAGRDPAVLFVDVIAGFRQVGA